MEELKPCPFCGNSIKMEKGSGDITYFKCNICWLVCSFKGGVCKVGVFDEVKNPIVAWNTRANI